MAGKYLTEKQYEMLVYTAFGLIVARTNLDLIENPSLIWTDARNMANNARRMLEGQTVKQEFSTPEGPKAFEDLYSLALKIARDGIEITWRAKAKVRLVAHTYPVSSPPTLGEPLTPFMDVEGQIKGSPYQSDADEVLQDMREHLRDKSRQLWEELLDKNKEFASLVLQNATIGFSVEIANMVIHHNED